MPELLSNSKMSFSGQDADVFVYIPAKTGLILLDSIQTVSVSVFRDKVPVRALGYANVKGHTRGVRTIAGSMVFAVLNDHPLKALTQRYDYEWSFDRYIGQSSSGSNTIFSDIIPPFNVLIKYQNELGSAALLELIGVDITNEGVVTSIEDLLTEKTLQYRARDLREFQAYEDKSANLSTRQLLDFNDKDISDIFLDFPEKSGSSLSVPKADGKSLSSKLKGTFRG